MKSKLLIFLTLISFGSFAQNRMYNLTTQFDSVKVRKLLMTSILEGGANDSVLVKKANGGLFKVARSSFGGGGGSGTVTNFSKVDGFGIISSVANPSTTPVLTIRTDTTQVRSVLNSYTKAQTDAKFLNYVDLTTNQTAAGNKTWSGASTFNNTITNTASSSSQVASITNSGTGSALRLVGTGFNTLATLIVQNNATPGVGTIVRFNDSAGDKMFDVNTIGQANVKNSFSIGTAGVGSSLFFGASTITPGIGETAYPINFQPVSGTFALTQQPVDQEITDSTKGIILKSPNGTRWRVTVSNAGALVVTSL